MLCSKFTISFINIKNLLIDLLKWSAILLNDKKKHGGTKCYRLFVRLT